MTKNRMKRRQPANAKPGKPVYDIKEAYTKDQLAEIGAIALTWNQIDAMIDFQLLVTLDLPIPIWLDVTKRINGMEGKLAILRLYSERNKILTDDARSCIKSAFDTVAEYKTYRDAVIHSLIFDVEKGIAQRIGSRAESYQILVTMEALTALYNRLALLRDELRQVDLLLRLGDAEAAVKLYRYAADPSRLRRERDVPGVTNLVREQQKRRLSLPPLPEFPSEDELQLLQQVQTAAVSEWLQVPPDEQDRK